MGKLIDRILLIVPLKKKVTVQHRYKGIWSISKPLIASFNTSEFRLSNTLFIMLCILGREDFIKEKGKKKTKKQLLLGKKMNAEAKRYTFLKLSEGM